MSIRHIFILSLLCSLHTASASADEASFWKPPSVKADRYRQQMALGDRLARAASHYRLEGIGRQLTEKTERWALADQALLAYEEAIKVDPQKAEPHFRAGALSTQFQTSEDFPSKSELERAIAHFDAFEALAPLDARLPDVLFSRSLLHTKRGGKRHIEQGIADYDAQLALIDQATAMGRSSTSTILSNRAELHMMLGRLEEAIIGYEEAIAFEDNITYGYGLAVALDRDGQGFRARKVARDYALRDNRNALHRDGTFFVPAGEIFYYIALRAEGLGQYAQAQAAYGEYLRRLPGSLFAGRARKNLAVVKKKKPPRAKRRPSLRRRL